MTVQLHYSLARPSFVRLRAAWKVMAHTLLLNAKRHSKTEAKDILLSLWQFIWAKNYFLFKSVIDFNPYAWKLRSSTRSKRHPD
jgi:hypothetical protein